MTEDSQWFGSMEVPWQIHVFCCADAFDQIAVLSPVTLLIKCTLTSVDVTTRQRLHCWHSEHSERPQNTTASICDIMDIKFVLAVQWCVGSLISISGEHKNTRTKKNLEWCCSLVSNSFWSIIFFSSTRHQQNCQGEGFEWNFWLTRHKLSYWKILESRSEKTLILLCLALEARGATPFQPLQGCHSYTFRNTFGWFAFNFVDQWDTTVSSMTVLKQNIHLFGAFCVGGDDRCSAHKEENFAQGWKQQ